MSGEERLPGGLVSDVVRIGSTVRRRPGPRSAFVRRLLDLLAASGWTGAPRFLGSDPDGRDVLEFIEGLPGHTDTVRPLIGDGAALVAVTRLVRELHDLTAGSELAGDAEVVCHHDLDPRNTIYRPRGSALVPVALIDWDRAGPGRWIDDVAHLAWQFLPLALTPAAGLDDIGRRLRLICSGYGLDDRAVLIPAVLDWQDRCWRGIVAEAAAGDPAMSALVDRGVVSEIRASRDWTGANAAELTARIGPS